MCRLTTQSLTLDLCVGSCGQRVEARLGDEVCAGRDWEWGSCASWSVCFLGHTSVAPSCSKFLVHRTDITWKLLSILPGLGLTALPCPSPASGSNRLLSLCETNNTVQPSRAPRSSPLAHTHSPHSRKVSAATPSARCQNGSPAPVITMPAAVAWTLLLSLTALGAEPGSPFPSFRRPGATFDRAAVDGSTGTVYVGAVNRLYQLSADLSALESEGSTGPVNDSRDCLPPIDRRHCPQARPTQVHSQLLLVDREGGTLLACGSALQGLCEKRSLRRVALVVEREEQPGETQYVAADLPGTATVGALGLAGGGRRALFVGRGYTRKATDPPVSTRRLDSPQPFSNEDLGKLVVAGGGFADYDHRFLSAFARPPHVYFLFNRRDPRGRRTPAGSYRPYLARICSQDSSYYSYVEVPLSCGRGHSLAVASALGEAASEGPALYVTFARPQHPPHQARPTDQAALCVYPLAALDRAIERAREACYSSHHTQEARVEYDVKSSCTLLPKDSPVIFPCGDEHTPSPIASTVPVPPETVVSPSVSVLLTAVAVTAEMNNTIVFLGDRLGRLHKVFLRPVGEAEFYSTLTIDEGSPVNKDLLFDPAREHIYVMTTSQLVMVPVANCSQYSDCNSCLGARDPYCGWCVLEGRCSRKLECGRYQEANRWLWVYASDGQCTTVLAKVPGNLSRHEQREVQLVFGGLPALGPGEGLACWFGEHVSPAAVQGNVVSCQTPSEGRVPPNHPGQDHVSVGLSLRSGPVTVASTDFVFYDCGSVPRLHPTSPCQACVSSVWKCSWCLRAHRCVGADGCRGGHIVSSQLEEVTMQRGPELCPRVERMEGAVLIPIGQQRALRMTARNLNLLAGEQRFECVVGTGEQPVVMGAKLQENTLHRGTFHVTCTATQFELSARTMESQVPVSLRDADGFQIDRPEDLQVTLYDCGVGQADCSRCQALSDEYGCAWCGGEMPACRYQASCQGAATILCPPPVIEDINPRSAPIQGGTTVTIIGTDLGKRFRDIEHSVTVAGLPCHPEPREYRVSTRIVCRVTLSKMVRAGPVQVSVGVQSPVTSRQTFTYQDPQLSSIFPERGPLAGGTALTITGTHLLTGSQGDISVYLGPQACPIVGRVLPNQLVCRTSRAADRGPVGVMVKYGGTERVLDRPRFLYTENPRIHGVQPTHSFFSGGRMVEVDGEGLDVVQQPLMVVRVEAGSWSPATTSRHSHPAPQESEYSDTCNVTSATHMRCRSPGVPPGSRVVSTSFLLDNLVLDFSSVAGAATFEYCRDPVLRPLNSNQPSSPFKYKPGSVLSVEGEDLDLAMTMEEVQVLIGEEACVVKTLSHHNLYCTPPKHQPPAGRGATGDGERDFPELVVLMGNLRFELGRVQYDTEGQPSFPLEAKVGLAAAAALVVLLVGVIILIYRKKSKKAVRDYRKVLIQLVNLETSVGDQCRREFTDLMTEMMDLTGDLEGTRIPFRDYRAYAVRMFFPGHRESPLSWEPEVPESRRLTIEQGLEQLNNLLNNKPFLIKLVQTLEEQGSFTPRDRGYVASLLTVALHGKLEYLTDILRSLLSELVVQYVARNPKLMLRRTETVVEKLLTNWISLCHYTFLRNTAGEALYTLVRAIKHQVDKGPVDQITGKAKYTLNDNRLLQEAVEYRPLTLNVLMKTSEETAPFPAKVLDVDTIDQAKEKVLDQMHKGVPYSQRPRADSLDLEWRAGVGGHLTLSNEDVTSELLGRWKRLNTLLHYKVPDGATVALVPKASGALSQDRPAGEKTPMLEDGEEGVRYWHLVKPAEEPDVPEQNHGSVRERERAKAIPEIYLTRLLSMKGIHQKFVDDVFHVILSASHPVPLAVKYFFDFLDEEAALHGIADPETIHIWKTNSLPLRFWLTVLKNPQLIFDLQLSDNVDAALSVIAQTFMDSCTTGEHKVGRDSPINKLLYAKEIPRYRQMVEKFYADIQQMGSASYQEMNSALTELSGNSISEVHSTAALHELYKYISKYYNQIISALEEDYTGQKMQLSCRLQQVAALVENKVTDL